MSAPAAAAVDVEVTAVNSDDGKVDDDVTEELAVRSFKTFFGGFLSSWKKYFLSTYGRMRPVPNGSKSVNASDFCGNDISVIWFG